MTTLNVDALKIMIAARANSLEMVCPELHLDEIEWTRIERYAEKYHVNIKYRIDIPREKQNILDCVKSCPWIGFDFNLDTATDEQVVETVERLFKEANVAFKYLTANLESILLKKKMERDSEEESD